MTKDFSITSGGASKTLFKDSPGFMVNIEPGQKLYQLQDDGSEMTIVGPCALISLSPHEPSEEVRAAYPYRVNVKEGKYKGYSGYWRLEAQR